MTYRSKKYLSLARGEDCKVKIPGVCNGDTSTTICAHSNKVRHGKGMGFKARDYYVAHCCSSCHDAIDGRLHTHLSPQDMDEFWQRGFERTLDWAFDNGHIEFK
jgi:Protein of unknown function (DUF1364)